MENHLKVIYDKLEEFILKYHLFKIIKGTFLFIGLFILIFLIQSVVEYFNYMNVKVKTILFYYTLALLFILLLIYFIIPLLALLKLRKRITYKRAAYIISVHFPEIEDKLLNTIELADNLTDNLSKNDLLIASINQRIFNLSPIPFKNALNFQNLKRNFLFTIISFAVLLIIVAFNPKVITDGSVRLINYSSYYEPNAPFRFILNNQNLVCEKNKDFEVNLKIKGDYIPENVYIVIGNNRFLMNKTKKPGDFIFIIRNVNNNLDFGFFADKYQSKYYNLSVLPSPVLKSFTLNIVPPAYTKIEPFKIVNSGDCTIPSGSLLSWNFKTLYVDHVNMILATDTVLLKSSNQDFQYKYQVLHDLKYSLQFFNSNFKNQQAIDYSINVIPDLFPEIEIKQLEDSLKIGAYYFMVSIRDDYGFNNLSFAYKIANSDSTKNLKSNIIEINKFLINQDLFYYFDFNGLENIAEDSYIEYYFEVKDNDYINGFKASRSTTKIYNLPDKEDIKNIIDEKDKLRDESLAKSKALTKTIQKDIEEFRRKELSNELTDWDKKEFLKNISEKQKELDKFIEHVLDQNKKSNQLNNQFYEEQKNILEKQKQIQELLDQILDDELKELLKEIEKLSEKFNSEDFEKLRQKLDLSYQNLEKKLDRSLELLKRYQVEENVVKLAEDLKDISKKQHSLSDELNKKVDKNEILKKQNKLNEEFNRAKDNFDETLKKNKDLKSPYKMDEFNKEFESIEQKMDELHKEMPESPIKKTKQNQEKISKDIDELAAQMESLFKEMEMQSIEMSLENLRQIIDNLSIFSFSQEDNYTNTLQNLPNNPKYRSIVVEQDKIKNDFKIIEDSLNSLMTKVPQMNKMILKEIENIKYNSEKATTLLEQLNRMEALKVQRYILNSANTLDLYLSELLDQLQNQMQGGSGGKQSKNKPGQAMDNLKKQQQNLKDELEKLIEEMKRSEGKKDQSGMNDQIVKTLAEQEIFNQMLQEMQNGKGIRPETLQKLKEIKRLSDQNIDDLINKRITPELFNRNQKILTRLLESEKSEREREQENKRESKEGSNKEFVIPEELKESMKNTNNYRETLQKSNLYLKNYYKNLSDEYFRLINK